MTAKGISVPLEKTISDDSSSKFGACGREGFDSSRIFLFDESVRDNFGSDMISKDAVSENITRTRDRILTKHDRIHIIGRNSRSMVGEEPSRR